MLGQSAVFSNVLNRLLRRTAPFPPLPCPEPAVCIIGDVHGRSDLLNRLLERIQAHPRAQDVQLVFVGDLIDRGPDSAGVLAQVHRLVQGTEPGGLGPALCLMGNHERMMLDFLDDPQRHGARWITAGGAETLASFGMPPWRAGPDMGARATALRTALPPGQEAWLRGLPLIWQTDGLAVTHAGADPNRPLTNQTEQALLWGHSDFPKRPRDDGVWVAHGHTIVAEACASTGRIAVDTGAWRRNRLSAAWLGPDGLSFLHVTHPSG